MKLEFTQKDEIGIVKIIGRLDASKEKNLKTQFVNFLKETKFFVFDCSELEFIDSTGLGAIISNLKNANVAGGEIYIADLQEKPRMLFEITRAYKIFEVFDSVDAAVSSIKSQVEKAI